MNNLKKYRSTHLTIPSKSCPLKSAHVPAYLQARDGGLQVTSGQWYDGHETKAAQIFSPKKESAPQKNGSVITINHQVLIFTHYFILFHPSPKPFGDIVFVDHTASKPIKATKPCFLDVL